MVANRLRKNLQGPASAWREREGVTCFRAYDADLPGIFAARSTSMTSRCPTRRLWLHVQEYAAPDDIPEADYAASASTNCLSAVREVFEVPRERVALKTRSTGKGGSKYGHFDHRGEFLRVREGSADVQVNLFDYLDTGLFLDHRPLRARMALEARGRASSTCSATPASPPCRRRWMARWKRPAWTCPPPTCTGGRQPARRTASAAPGTA